MHFFFSLQQTDSLGAFTLGLLSESRAENYCLIRNKSSFWYFSQLPSHKAKSCLVENYTLQVL